MSFPAIRCEKDIEDIVQEYGFLPFFTSAIPGFSIEEMADRKVWFPPQGEGVWEWKDPVIRGTGAAYGRFILSRPGFASPEFFGMLASYDLSRQFIVKHNGEGMTTNLLASAVSGFCCAFTSLPFDLMKTRLMNMRPDPVTNEMPYKNLLDCFVKVLKNEGLFAFWRGFFTYYFRCAPHAMIILLVNEAINPAYDKLFLRGGK